MKRVIDDIILEKFTEDSDPVRDMGIGLYHVRTFDTLKKAMNFILLILPGILKTSEIPDDVIFLDKYDVGAFKWKYYYELYYYCRKYIIVNDRQLNFESICQELWKKLLKMGYPKIDQRTNKDPGDPFKHLK
jgi:hypothetical protein